MKRFGIVICSICIALHSAELFTRWYAPQPVYTRGPESESCYLSDSTLYSVLKPHTRCKSSSKTNPAEVYINALGLRDTKDKSAKNTPNTKRILFVGDSYTFGHGVMAQDSFPFRIESILIGRHQRVEVLNAGIPGVGPDWYYLFVKERAFSYSPDLIVVGLYLGNDLSDYAYFDRTKRDSAGLPLALETSLEYVDADNTRRTSDTPWQYTIPVLRDSHLFIAVANRLYPPTPTKVSFSVNGSGCYLKPACTDADDDIQKTVLLVHAMATIAKERATPIVFILLPWEAQLPRNLSAASGGYLIAATAQQRHAISDKVGAAIGNLDLPYIDLLAAFDAHPTTEAVYTPTDYHWNTTGHKIAADYLAPKLEAILFPPSGSETE